MDNSVSWQRFARRLATALPRVEFARRWCSASWTANSWDLGTVRRSVSSRRPRERPRLHLPGCALGVHRHWRVVMRRRRRSSGASWTASGATVSSFAALIRSASTRFRPDTWIRASRTARRRCARRSELGLGSLSPAVRRAHPLRGRVRAVDEHLWNVLHCQAVGEPTLSDEGDIIGWYGRHEILNDLPLTKPTGTLFETLFGEAPRHVRSR